LTFPPAKTINGDMAEREDIRDRVRRINPQALRIMDMLDEQCRKTGCTGASVTATEDMTPEETEMALLEGFLKEGYPPDTAAAKAREWKLRIEQLLG
jgi:hypothetical protein